jgi:hypothetical protein
MAGMHATVRAALDLLKHNVNRARIIGGPSLNTIRTTLSRTIGEYGFSLLKLQSSKRWGLRRSRCGSVSDGDVSEVGLACVRPADAGLWT